MNAFALSGCGEEQNVHDYHVHLSRLKNCVNQYLYSIAEVTDTADVKNRIQIESESF